MNEDICTVGVGVGTGISMGNGSADCVLWTPIFEDDSGKLILTS
jgi:hypothetical protein